MSKFDKLITKADQEIIQSVFVNLDLLPIQKMNVIETLENIVYLHPTFFEKFKFKEKVRIFTVLATVFDTLLDDEINPLSRKYMLRTFDCFNNNIFDIKGEFDYVDDICEKCFEEMS